MSFLNNFFSRYKKDQGISALALCWLAYAISYLSRSNMAISLVSLEDKYAFSLPQVSLLGTLFFVAYAVGQLINGRLGDITTPRRMITAGLLVAAVSNVLFGALSSYPVLAALWTINGFALSALWGPITRMMAHYFKGHKRNTVSMLMMTSPAVGCLVSWGLCSKIISRWNYQVLFIGTGILVFVYGIVFLLLVPTPQYDTEPADGKTAIIHLSVIKKIIPVISICICIGFIKEGINFFAPYILDNPNSGTSVASFSMYLPLFSLMGSISSASLNKQLRFSITRTLMVVFGVSFISLLTIQPALHLDFNHTVFLIVLLGISSAMMYAATTVLLAFFPMRFDKMGTVSHISGLLDFFAYMGAGVSSWVSASLLESKGLSSVLYLWMLLALLVFLLNILMQKTKMGEALHDG